MKRRTLDILFSTGGLILAVLLLIAGIVLTSNANFANDYVEDQLTAQKISGAGVPSPLLVWNEGSSSCSDAGPEQASGGRLAADRGPAGLVP
jgi:hypothetical protein